MHRFFWTLRLACIFYFDQLGWALKQFKHAYQTPRTSWQYARALAKDNDFYDEVAPREAFELDRAYWGDY